MASREGFWLPGLEFNRFKQYWVLAEGTGTDPEALRLQALSRRCPSLMGLPSIVWRKAEYSKLTRRICEPTDFQSVSTPG
jgi:hypothetical protein